jgi:uncharacterized protein (TIGR03546 family)
MLKAIARLIKALNSENDPSQISFAFCFSMIVGLTPFFSLHNIFVLSLVLFIRVNLSAFLLGLMLFSGIAYMLDPLFHFIGLVLLEAKPLQGLWTDMYNSPFWRLERFNNSVVMGSVVISTIFFIPLHLLIKEAILKYRLRLLAWAEKNRLMKIIKASKFYHVYASITG